MTSDCDTFVQGATAFRNASDLAQGAPRRLIQPANARARQSNVVSPPEAEITVAVAEQYEESTDEFVDCEDYPGSQAVGIEDYAASRDVDEEPALPPYLCAEGEEPSQESTSLGAEPAMSFATSFSQSQTSSKRTRASHSPPSNSQPRKKYDRAKGRVRRSAPRRAAGSSAQGSTSSGSAVVLQPASAEEYWPWGDEYQKWYHLNEDGSYIWDDGEQYWRYRVRSIRGLGWASLPHLTADLTRVAAVGESAGGFLTLQSALVFNGTARLRADVAQCPAMFLDLPAFAPRPAAPDAGLEEVVAGYQARAAAGKVVTSRRWPERVDLLQGGSRTGGCGSCWGMILRGG